MTYHPVKNAAAETSLSHHCHIPIGHDPSMALILPTLLGVLLNVP
jgi:hypothetical protein